jgi:cell division protein ZapE
VSALLKPLSAEPSQAHGLVERAYFSELERRGYTADSAQLAAVAALQQLCDALIAFKASRSNAFKKLIYRTAPPHGLWLYGGVGRGKSFLMDCFFNALPYRRKTRLHFHEFMRAVHRELDELKGTADPLDEVAIRVAKRYRVICFDEFHVSDIADAMILERLMRGLFLHGVVFVMTSNYKPSELYPDGLHRDRILPAIEVIESHVQPLNVDAGHDYRRASLAQVQAYLFPLNAANAQRIRGMYEKLADGRDEDVRLDIEGREIKALRRSGGVVWFDFKTLCGGPRSQNDYLVLAQRFHTLVLSEVPQMSAAMASEARRFVWLVDVLYDQKVKLLTSAACEPGALYTAGQMAHEFFRTASRLVEMQSDAYLQTPRRGLAARLG